MGRAKRNPSGRSPVIDGFRCALPILRFSVSWRSLAEPSPRIVGWVERSETHLFKQPMTDYRRNFILGGSFFFTVNLEDRRLRLLTEHIDRLRSAFRETRQRHPFAIDALV